MNRSVLFYNSVVLRALDLHILESGRGGLGRKRLDQL